MQRYITVIDQCYNLDFPLGFKQHLVYMTRLNFNMAARWLILLTDGRNITSLYTMKLYVNQHHILEINDVQNVLSTLNDFLWDINLHYKFSEATFSNFRRHEIYEKKYRHPKFRWHIHICKTVYNTKSHGVSNRAARQAKEY